MKKIISKNELVSTIWKRAKNWNICVEKNFRYVISEIWNNVKSVPEIKVPVPVNVNQRLESGFDEKIIE